MLLYQKMRLMRSWIKDTIERQALFASYLVDFLKALALALYLVQLLRILGIAWLLCQETSLKQNKGQINSELQSQDQQIQKVIFK